MRKLMTLEDVTNFMKTLNSSENWGIKNFYRGKLDNKQEKSLGIYNLKHGSYELMVGGPENKSYEDLYVSLLIHWDKSYTPCEEVSNKIYMKLVDFYKVVDGFKIGEFDVNFIEMLSGNEDVGTDEKNVYERVIEFKICYNPYVNS